MKKYASYISAIFLTLILAFAVSGFLFPQTVLAQGVPAGESPVTGSAQTQTLEEITVTAKAKGCGTNVGCHIMREVVVPLAEALLKFAGLLTGLSGVVLNAVIYHTVVNVANNYANIPAINSAWGTIRDVANMGFIFILLYAAIRTILGIENETKKLVMNVIIVAILINFSLFATKLVIDASNILALTFYDAIVPTADLNAGNILSQPGLSDTFMQHLNLQSLYNASGQSIEFGTIITITLMGSIMLVIAAFVFFSITIMFIIRYVVLILVLILSPIAFMAYAFPGLEGEGKKWKDALMGQAFFAPIYFMITWIAIIVLKDVMSSLVFGVAGDAETNLSGIAFVGQPGQERVNVSGGSFAMFMNFMVIIVFLLASLAIAKSWASKAGFAVTGATKWLTGKAGNAGFGGLSWAGRKSLGLLGTAAAETAGLQKAARDKTGLAGAGSRLALYASQKLSRGTYDARNITVPTSVIGDFARGTLGRTKIGQKFNLHDINIPNIPVGEYAAGQTDIGEGGKKSYLDTREESEKRVHERETEAADALAKAETEKNVKQGVKNKDVSTIEKALIKSSDKEVETLVTNNREILKSQEFANSLSVKQLEALIKSDKFSEAEKDLLKNKRFSAIYAGIAAKAIPEADRDAEQIAAAKGLRQATRDLSNTELEMMDPIHLENPEFVSNLKSSQIDAIRKSTKFTTSQKNSLRDVSRIPLSNALDTSRGDDYSPNPDLVKNIIRDKFSHKDVAGLMNLKARFVNHSGETVTGTTVLIHPDVMKTYTPKLLRRMAEEMSTADVQVVREAIKKAGESSGASETLTGLAKWLNTEDGINSFS